MCPQPWQRWHLTAWWIWKLLPALAVREAGLPCHRLQMMYWKTLNVRWIDLVSQSPLTHSYWVCLRNESLTSVKSILKKKCLPCHIAVFRGFCSARFDVILSVRQWQDTAQTAVGLGQELRAYRKIRHKSTSGKLHFLSFTLSHPTPWDT